jgi:hypothetical protein
VSSTIDVSSRKNLAQISRVLTQITTGNVFSENVPSYIPINDYVGKAISQLGAWLIEGTAAPILRGKLLTASSSCDGTRRGDRVPCFRVFGCDGPAKANLYLAERSLRHTGTTIRTPSTPCQ